MSKVIITKQYRDGRIISFEVDESHNPNENGLRCSLTKRKAIEKQDGKYYNAIHSSFDMKDIIDSFNDLCTTTDWD